MPFTSPLAPLCPFFEIVGFFLFFAFYRLRRREEWRWGGGGAGEKKWTPKERTARVFGEILSSGECFRIGRGEEAGLEGEKFVDMVARFIRQDNWEPVDI